MFIFPNFISNVLILLPCVNWVSRIFLSKELTLNIKMLNFLGHEMKIPNISGGRNKSLIIIPL